MSFVFLGVVFWASAVGSIPDGRQPRWSDVAGDYHCARNGANPLPRPFLPFPLPSPVPAAFSRGFLTPAGEAGRLPAMQYAIQFEDITKVYEIDDQRVHALRGVSGRIEKGSFWAIMGSSGSGKSTLLSILGCLDRPTSGRYLLGGEDVSGLDDDALSDIRLRHLGFVFQSFNLVPQLTVAENIALPLYYQGVPESESARRAQEFARVVGLEARLGHRPSQLSGGQQQRAAIARALATDPTVILADEPTGNLDTATSVEIMKLFSSLHERGKTIVMVTHEPDIADWAQHRIVMRDGLVKEVR